MTRRLTKSSQGLAALALAASLLGLGGPVASAAAKPADEMVPAGATVLYWNSDALSGVGSPSGSVTVTNLAVINQVRDLINGLPLTVPGANRVCPDDMMIPTVVSFALNATTTPFTRVLFQLGGCPYARVYQHGRAVAPTLGGKTLVTIYGKIRQLVTPAS